MGDALSADLQDTSLVMSYEPIYGPFISRSQAKAQGLKHYFTGKACKHGHIALRKVKGECMECLEEGRYRATKEQVRVNMARHRARTTAPLRENGIPKICPYCKKTWKKPYGSTAAYCSAECRTKARRANANRSAAKPENRARKSVRESERTKSLRETDSEWRHKTNQRVIARRKERRRTDPQLAIRDACSNRINSALRAQGATKSKTTMKLLGCNAQHLMESLVKQFKPGMTWEDRSKWHIDHVRPTTYFDLTDQEQQRVCFNWRNMQPLWPEENIEKGDQYSPNDEEDWAIMMLRKGFEGDLFLVYRHD